MSTPALPGTPQAPGGASSPANGHEAWELDPDVVPNLDELVTEDGKPVDSMFMERQYRLLTEPLCSSWAGPGEGRPFLVVANVGWFHTYREAAVVPDCMLILDVRPVAPPREKEGRSYYQWLYGRPPDVVIEIVLDKRGDEEGYKMRLYARQRVQYYMIFDPGDLLGGGVLRAYELRGRRYVATEGRWLADVGLGLALWEGVYQDLRETWLRWCDQAGTVIQTGAERATAGEERARRLAEQLRRLGVEPEA